MAINIRIYGKLFILFYFLRVLVFFNTIVFRVVNIKLINFIFHSFNHKGFIFKSVALTISKSHWHKYYVCSKKNFDN